MSVCRSVQAEDDALGIALHIADDSPVAAERFLDQLESAVAQLRRFPLSGPQIALPQFPTLRCLAVPEFPKYLVFYTVKQDEVMILRIGSALRDWSAILDRT